MFSDTGFSSGGVSNVPEEELVLSSGMTLIDEAETEIISEFKKKKFVKSKY